MNRRIARAAAIATMGLALVPGVGVTFGQEAASPTVDGYGWWNQSQQVPAQVEQAPTLAPAPLPVEKVAVPAPPTAPADGLYVAGEGSAEPTAISAVRFLGAGTGGGTLTLTVAGAPPSGQEELAACPIPGGFTPTQNGRWDSKPSYDPASCTVVGTVDGSTVTFALDATFVSTLGDIQAVIVPKPGSSTPIQLGFEKPANESLVPTGGAVSGGSSDFAPIDSSSSFDTGSSSFDVGAAPSAAFDAPATDAPAAGEVAAAPVQEVAAAPARAVSENRTARMVAVALMLAIGAAFWWLSNQPERAPRLLGSLAGAARTAAAVPSAAVVATTGRARGVGRFARHRAEPPTPI